MFLRAYLRASTTEQNAGRAKESLTAFAADHRKKIASFYVESESGAILTRPELMRLISDAGEKETDDCLTGTTYELDCFERF